ncbi:MAG: YMGG-like glycine zipper-containing protein [Gemmatimonadota bacterium]
MRFHTTLAALAGAILLGACATAERTETVRTQPEAQTAPGGAAGVGIVSTRNGHMLPSGYEFPVTLTTEIGTENTNVGDRVIGRVSQDLTHQGRIVVAQGSQVQGTVTRVDDADRGQDSKSYLELDFDTLLLTDGSQYPLDAQLSQYQARFENDDDDTLKGAAVGAGAGAILGQVLGGDTGATVLGAVIGGAAGAVIESQTTGQDVSIPAGTTLWLNVAQPLTIRG